MVQCQGVPRLNGGPKSFLSFLYWLEIAAKIPKVQRGPAQCKSSLGKNMISYKPYQ